MVKKGDTVILQRGGAYEVVVVGDRAGVGCAEVRFDNGQIGYAKESDCRAPAEGEVEGVRRIQELAGQALKELRASRWGGGGPSVYTR